MYTETQLTVTSSVFSQRAAGLPPTTKRPADIRRGELRLPVYSFRPGGLCTPLPTGGGPEWGCPLPRRPPYLEGPVVASRAGGTSIEALHPLHAVRRVQRPEHLHRGGRVGRRLFIIRGPEKRT